MIARWWANKCLMRRVAHLCNPDITDAEFEVMWAEHQARGSIQ